MNRKTLSIAIILAGLAGLLTFACEGKNSAPAAEKVESTGETAPMVSEAAATVELRGRLESSDSGGLLLVDGQERYELKCDSDLSHLMEKTIKVKGTLMADDSGSFIYVAQAAFDSAGLTE